jgi:hypothetical protein
MTASPENQPAPTDAEVCAWLGDPARRPSINVGIAVVRVRENLGLGSTLTRAIDLAAQDTGMKPEAVAANWESIREIVALSRT